MPSSRGAQRCGAVSSTPWPGYAPPHFTGALESRRERLIRPAFPALTCSAQATYLTGKTPSEHGIVGNGWYDRTLNEHHFWKQSNQLVQGEKLWESIRRDRKDFRSFKLFWWYNMYSSADYSITPRPLYGSDGNKVFDVHSQPLELRHKIKRDLGEFPFPSFWGPTAGIDSSQWIAESARWIEERHQPDLSLVYLPHLDYDLQRFGPNDPRIKTALRAIDEVAGDLIDFFEERRVRVIVLSEYGITEVRRTIHPNREFRHQGWLRIKEEFGLDAIDCGSSRAFALTDHQIAPSISLRRMRIFAEKFGPAWNPWMGWPPFSKAKPSERRAWIIHEPVIWSPLPRRTLGSLIIIGRTTNEPPSSPDASTFTVNTDTIRPSFSSTRRSPTQTSGGSQAPGQEDGVSHPYGSDPSGRRLGQGKSWGDSPRRRRLADPFRRRSSGIRRKHRSDRGSRSSPESLLSVGYFF